MAMICDFRRLFGGLLNRCCEEAYTRLSLPQQDDHDNL
jgi:hypothetical protein